MKKNPNSTKKRNIFKWIIVAFLLLFFLGITAVIGIFFWADQHIDAKADAALFDALGTVQTTRIYAKKPGSSEENKEKSWAEYDLVYAEENILWKDYQEISPQLFNAFVAIEDKRFYEHRGVDWLRTGKAVLNYLGKHDKRFGGSTITQQVIKNVCDERDISPKRKAKEILRALRLEKARSKENILAVYANIVPLANHCVGVGAASRYYFNKQPNELTLLECATLAAITNSPSRYNPITHLDSNQNRAKLILEQMRKQGYITEQEYQDALNDTLTFKQGISESPHSVQDWFTETLLSEVIEDLVKEKNMTYTSARRLVYSGGLQIMASVDANLQKQVTSYFENANHFYHNPKETSLPDYAFVCIDAKTGYLIATAGGVGNKTANRIQNGIYLKRPPGSALKPLALYLPAIETKKAHWGTTFEDMPQEIESGDKITLWPKNSPDVYQGRISLAHALAYSKNTVAVTLYHILGPKTIYHHLTKLGMTDLVWENQGKTDLAPAPLALGQLTNGISLRTLTNAYTPLVMGGNFQKSKSYYYVLDAKGNTILGSREEAERICSPQTSYILTKMLEGVTEFGTAKPLSLKYSVDVAGKTGTSGGDKDRLFIGYTPEFLCGVRCSSVDGKAIGDRAKSPLYIWDDCMKKLYASREDYEVSFSSPGGVIYSSYCLDSGELVSPACLYDLRGARVGYGFFTPDNRPVSHCQMHKEVSGNLFDGSFSFSPTPFSFFSSYSLLNVEKKEIEDKIKTLDRQYRLWYHMDSTEKQEGDFPFAFETSNKRKSKYPRRFLHFKGEHL